jgi:putative addiction module component (TIGR02574 family)
MIALTKEKVARQALALSRDDRADVAAVILDSLRAEEEAIDPVIEAAWIEEAEKIIEACERGEVKTVPLEEVKRKYRQRYGK